MSSARIYEKKSDIVTELCRICNFVKSVGLLAEIYEETTGHPLPAGTVRTTVITE